MVSGCAGRALVSGVIAEVRDKDHWEAGTLLLPDSCALGAVFWWRQAGVQLLGLLQGRQGSGTPTQIGVHYVGLPRRLGSLSAVGLEARGSSELLSLLRTVLVVLCGRRCDMKFLPLAQVEYVEDLMDYMSSHPDNEYVSQLDFKHFLRAHIHKPVADGSRSGGGKVFARSCSTEDRWRWGVSYARTYSHKSVADGKASAGGMVSARSGSVRRQEVVSARSGSEWCLQEVVATCGRKSKCWGNGVCNDRAHL